MNQIKSKIFYCICNNSSCNVTVYDYTSNNNNSTIIVIPVYSKINYPFKCFFNDISLKFIDNSHFKFVNNICQKFDYIYDVNNFLNTLVSIVSFPFKFIYNLMYYFIKPIETEYNIILVDSDENKVNKILKKRSLNIIGDTFIINKENLRFIQKLEYILTGEIKLVMNAECYKDKLYIDYK